ncbi:MAG: universal stress protein [Candidatus Krumholzibacteria bacterium]|nr:universal stress protein [Candidatus Krumholzibacteria bacterium]
MPDITKVLFTTDFSELSNHALPYAIKMAKLYDAELVMLHAVTIYDNDPNDPTYHFPLLQSYCEQATRSADERFQFCFERAGEAGVRVRKALVQGISPHAAILEFIEQEGGIGLICMSTHGRSGLKHVLLGSVTENVIRYAPCPILAVKQTEHEFIDPDTHEAHIRKILFPFDFSRESLKPLEMLKSIAGINDAEITVLHSIDVEIPPVYYTSGVTSILQLDPGLKERILEKMHAELDGPLEGHAARFIVTEGRAVDRIREEAAEGKSDLIVMGAAGSNKVGDFLFGSTVARVIQKAVCPVLVV